MTGLTLEDVVAGYPDRTVLDGVSLTVDEGEFLGIVGPNGAGKTTLLRTVNGVVEPDAGTVRVGDADVAASSASELGRRVATVPQTAEVAFDFDVRDVVAMGRTPYRSRFSTATPEDRAAVDRALARTDTERFADRPVNDLSGGERRRVLFARALAQTTPVLLLDEPTASLDLHHTVRTLDLARSLVDDGKTVVAAIHDVDLAARYCDSIAVLADGEIRARGPPADVLTSATLEDAFGGRVAVTTNLATGSPTVTAFDTDDPADAPRVHVVGHGRPAAAALARLAAAGCRCTAGVLPEGDVAAEMAAGLHAETVTAPPFESVDDEPIERAERLIAAADVTVAAGDLRAANADLVADEPPVIAVAGAVLDRPTNPDRVTDAEDLVGAVGEVVAAD